MLETWDGKPGWRASDGLRGSPGMLDPLPGDVNGDRRVDLLDLAGLQGHLGLAAGALRGDGDLDHDAAVSRTDVAILTLNLGQHRAAPSPSPPPASPPPSAPAALRASTSRNRTPSDFVPTGLGGPARRITATRLPASAVDELLRDRSGLAFG